jgi:hypothetical protein
MITLGVETYVSILLNFVTNFKSHQNIPFYYTLRSIEGHLQKLPTIKRKNSCHSLLFVVILIFVRSRDFRGTYSHKRKHYLHQGTGLHTTYSMAQDIISAADSYSACQKIPRFLFGNRRIITVFTPPLKPILNQMNTVRPIQRYLPKMYFNVTHKCMPMSSQWSLIFATHKPNHLNISPLLHVCHMSRPPHPP